MSQHFTLLDRAIAWASPVRGLRRLQARASFEIATRAYEAAKTDRHTSGWRPTGASANSENRDALDVLRFRARDMERNNRTVASACQQWAGQVVGSGITPRAVHPDEKLRQRAMDAWKRFVETCDAEGQHDYYGLQQLAARTMFRDGEVLRRWSSFKGRANARIRLLEADHLFDSPNILSGTAPQRVQGIEFSPEGERLGYWLTPVHPGESDRFNLQALQPEFNNAGDIDHFFHVSRPGQVRGVSWLAPAMVGLRGLADIQEAMIWRKRIEACIGLVLSSPEPGGSAPVIGQQKKNDKGMIEETLRPGMIFRAGPGESATAFTPAASDGTIDFIRAELYAFCAITGLPYHVITGDASQANFSSLRAATLAGHVILDTVQWLVMIPRERRAFARVMQAEALQTLDRSFLQVASEWSPPVRPWVDPVKEVSAKIAEIRAGLQSMPDAMAERGLDWKKTLDEIEAFQKACDEKTIVLDTDARAVNGSGSLHQQATQPDAPQK